MCIVCAFVCDRFLLNQARQNTLGRYLLAASQGFSAAVRILLSLCHCVILQLVNKSVINCACLYVFRCLKVFVPFVGDIFDIFSEMGNITSLILPHRRGYFKNGHSKWEDFNCSGNCFHKMTFIASNHICMRPWLQVLFCYYVIMFCLQVVTRISLTIQSKVLRGR